MEIAEPTRFPSTTNSYTTALVSGGVAGMVVDIVLFPIDTLKTRLQSERGFWRSGAFRGVYKGIGPAAAGSAPTAALFFCTYESFKEMLGKHAQTHQTPFVHMASASVAEVVACLIRVPVEIAKQRKQALTVRSDVSAVHILWDSYRKEGLFSGLYRGFGTTLMREIPFSLIQFPLWEFLKSQWTETTGTPLTPISVAICGAIAGGFAAGVTTPLDVIKTRIMLSEGQRQSPMRVLKTVYRERGISGLFAGFLPRVLWITLGGAIFFGFYDLTTKLWKSDDRK